MSNISDMKIDDTVIFRSKNSNDNVVWRGKVLGFLKYNLAKSYQDILSYYTATKRTNPELANIELLEYFVIQLTDVQAGSTTTRVFAKEWIEDGSFQILDEANVVIIKIYDITEAQGNDIVNSLKVQGYYAVQE